MFEVKDLPQKNMYSMFDIRFQKDGIFYFENVLSYPEKLLEVIEEVDLDEKSYRSISKWDNWTASDNKSFIIGSEKSIFTSNRYIDSGDDTLNKKILYIVNSLMMAPEMCAKMFYDGQIAYYKSIKKDDFDLPKPKLNMEKINLYKYNSSQGMGPHADSEDPTGTGSNLKYSLVTYLNDDYEGGEIEFKNQQVRIKPKAGSLVMFPSTYPFIHESLPTRSGRKVMYTTHWVI